MKRDLIRSIYEDMQAYSGKQVVLGGWARSIRDSKAFGFIDLNDGSCFTGAQIVFEREKIDNYTEIAKQNVGAALVVTGIVELTPEMKQPFEIKAISVEVEGTSTPRLSLAEKAPHGRVPARAGISAPQNQPVLGSIPRAQRGGLRHSYLLP